MKIRALVALAAIAGAVACTSTDPTSDDAPVDGFYEVRTEVDASDDPSLAADEILVRRAPPLDSSPDDPVEYLVTPRDPIAALDLRIPARWDTGDDGRPRILLDLDPSLSTSVREHTAEHIGDQVAVIIGGEVVSAHQIKQAIDLAQVAISACGEGVLERVWAALEEQGLTDGSPGPTSH